MSSQVTTAFVREYGTEIQLLAQQKKSRLRGTYVSGNMNAEGRFFEQIGTVEAEELTGRHVPTDIQETPHLRRFVTPRTYYVNDYIDDPDQLQTLTDPTNAYTQRNGAALGRRLDDTLITAFDAIAKTGKLGDGTQAFDTANQEIAAGGAGLTLQKLLDTKEILWNADIDDDDPMFIVCSPKNITTLLNTTEIKSSDFNTVKALAQGDVDTYMGFKFIRSTRLAIASDIRTTFAWVKSGMAVAFNEEMFTRTDERPDLHYLTQVYARMMFGATRLEETKVVRILADES